jgi:hypothetical protein
LPRNFHALGLDFLYLLNSGKLSGEATSSVVTPREIGDESKEIYTSVEVCHAKFHMIVISCISHVNLLALMT